MGHVQRGDPPGGDLAILAVAGRGGHPRRRPERGDLSQEGRRLDGRGAGSVPRRGRRLMGRCLDLRRARGDRVGGARGEPVRGIARWLGRAPSTGSRELSRNADRRIAPDELWARPQSLTARRCEPHAHCCARDLPSPSPWDGCIRTCSSDQRGGHRHCGCHVQAAGGPTRVDREDLYQLNAYLSVTAHPPARAGRSRPARPWLLCPCLRWLSRSAHLPRVIGCVIPALRCWAARALAGGQRGMRLSRGERVEPIRRRGFRRRAWRGTSPCRLR